MATLFLVFGRTSILFSKVAALVYIPTNRNCSLYCAHQSRARASKVQLFQHNLCPCPGPHQPHIMQPSSQASWAVHGPSHGCHCSMEYPRHSVLDNSEVKWLSHVWFFATPWTVAKQAPLSTGFSRQEYWSGLPFPSPGDLPNPGIKPRSPAFQADALTSEPPLSASSGPDFCALCHYLT